MSASRSNSRDRMLLGFASYRDPARRLAERANIPYGEIELHKFPDGESRVRLPTPLPDSVTICLSLDRPNEKLVDLILVADTARRLGARQLILVAPYLCYMRQDKEFHAGESVSQQIIGNLLAGHFDVVVTVDPHLHRVHALDQVVPDTHCITLTATEPMAVFLAGAMENPLLVGPDAESVQWVESIAAHRGYDYAVAKKKRTGDYDVDVELPPIDFSGRNVVLVDDIASSGRTLADAASKLKHSNAGSISVLVTHALFAEGALQQLQQSGVEKIWSTDSVLHDTNCIRLDKLLADSLPE